MGGGGPSLFSNGGILANIIIKRPDSFGKTRSEQEENLRKDGWGRTLSNEQLDKCKFLERKIKDKFGSNKNFLRPHEIDRVK